MAKELYLLRNGVNILTSPLTPINDFTVSVNHMGDNRLTAKFHYPERISFTLSEYVVYEKEGEYAVGDQSAFETYYLISPPTWTKDEKSLMLEYNCTFVAKQEILKFVPMIDTWEGIADGESPKKPSLYQTEYSFFGGVREYFINIKSSMVSEFGSRVDGATIQPVGWTLNLDLDNGYPQVGEDVVISISNMDVFSALQDMYEKFKVPFFINNTVITVGGEKNYVDYHFRYGKGKGLYKISKSPISDDIITKIRGVGSEKNLPYNYLQEEKRLAGLAPLPMSRLMPFIYRETLASATANPVYLSAVKEYYIAEDEYSQETPRMAFETYDDIFPTIRGSEYISPSGTSRADYRIDKIDGVYFEASAVGIENETSVVDDNEEVTNPRFWIKIPPLGFDLKAQLNEKDKLVISPTTGYCGGCRFNVLSIGSKNDEWRGFRASSYYEFDKFIGAECLTEIYTSLTGVTTRAVEKFTNEVRLPAGTDVTYSIPATIQLNKRDDSFGEASATVTIDLYKDGVFYKNIALEERGIYSGKQDYEILISGVESITETGDYKIRYAGDVLLTDNTVGGIRGFSVARIRAFEIQLIYLIPSEEFNNTKDVGQWLLVQKDLESYNTLMPYPSEPMWTSYASHDAWELGKDDPSHKNPVGLVPKIDDEYIFLGITLPDIYIIEAEKRLETALLLELNENKQHKYQFDCGFDEKLLMENPDINSDIKIGSIVLISESTKPDEEIEEADYEEMTINSLVLKYTPEKTIPSIE